MQDLWGSSKGEEKEKIIHTVQYKMHKEKKDNPVRVSSLLSQRICFPISAALYMVKWSLEGLDQVSYFLSYICSPLWKRALTTCPPDGTGRDTSYNDMMEGKVGKPPSHQSTKPTFEQHLLRGRLRDIWASNQWCQFISNNLTHAKHTCVSGSTTIKVQFEFSH